MKYGCIAEKLGHSFSREIHDKIGLYEYELREVPKGELDEFMKARDFLGINVTIPYKRDVMPYLDYIDDAAASLGAVNTIVNRGGKLYGYNTDFFGMRELLASTGIALEGKKVLILGTGGTSHTAHGLAESLGAAEIVTVSRTGRGDAVTYEEAYERHADADVIINTTPVGMFPETDGVPIDISSFPRVTGVADAVYNPLRTRLVLEARARGINAAGGLYMLVSQAVRAAEHFTGQTLGADVTDRVYSELLAEKENIVLTGMPGSGKSAIGRRIASETGRSLIDTDAVIVERIGMPISEYFALHGEGAFRDVETEVIAEVSDRHGCVISTGGGAILRKKNVGLLRKNGRIYYIDRPLDFLTPTASRPLASDREAIRKRYEERHDIYIETADVVYKAVDDRRRGINAKNIEELHGKR